MNEMSMNSANALANLLTNNSGLGSFGSEHLHKVSGIEGMNTFQTKPNSEYALFEEQSNIFCCKSTDASNTPSYRYFAFQEISKEEALQEISPYLMKGELDSFKENVLTAIRGELSSFKEEILNAQQFVRSNNDRKQPTQQHSSRGTDTSQ